MTILVVGCEMAPQQPVVIMAPPSGIEATASDAGTASASDGVDSDAVLASIAGGGYQTSASFTQVTRAPYPSVAAPGSMVSEWVSGSAAVAYEAVAPDGGAATAMLPVGATIVRAVLGDDGGVDKITLMVKGPQGYNPDLGDWWFGVASADGSPLEDADGGPMMGRLTQCYSCHLPRQSDDFVFGVPLDDR